MIRIRNPDPQLEKMLDPDPHFLVLIRNPGNFDRKCNRIRTLYDINRMESIGPKKRILFVSVADPKLLFRIRFLIRIRLLVSFGFGCGFRIRIRIWIRILDSNLDPDPGLESGSETGQNFFFLN